MKKMCDTGIKPLGRNFVVERMGSVILLNKNGQLPEVVWWPPSDLSNEILETYDKYYYFIDDEGYLVRR